MVLFELISNDYFTVKFEDFYDNNALQIVKKFSGKGFETVIYDKDRKAWKVKLEEYDEVFQQM